MKKLRPCRGCKSTAVKPAFRAEGTVYFSCSHCGLVYANKLPDDPQYEEYHRFDEYNTMRPYLMNIFRKIVQKAEHYKPSGKVLDIGTAQGFLMEAFKERRYECEGIEPSARAVELAQKRGLQVKKAFFGEYMPKKKYDIVILNHVFEHLPDPPWFLQKFRECLLEGGVLMIQVPNFGSWEAQYAREKWRYLVPKEHFLQLSPRSLRFLLEQEGYHILEMGTTGPLYDCSDPLSEIWRCITQDQKKLIFYLLEILPSTISQLFGRGSGLYVIARK